MNFESKIQKTIELFGSRWGKHTQAGFTRYEITVEEVNEILADISGWHKSNASNVFNGTKKAIGRFRSHVQMSDYADYELGYISATFERDVYTVLNTAEAAA